MIKHIVGIDPGTFKTGYIAVKLTDANVFSIIRKDHADNNSIKRAIIKLYLSHPNTEAAIETIVSYGNKIGQTTIETAIWAGMFYQLICDIKGSVCFIKRPDIKMNLCHRINGVKDRNVIQALKDRFGDIGTMKNPGRMYNLKDGLVTGGRPHVWSALAIATTYIDKKYGELK